MQWSVRASLAVALATPLESVTPPSVVVAWVFLEPQAARTPAATLKGFESYPVSKLVNSPKNDDARLLEPAAGSA